MSALNVTRVADLVRAGHSFVGLSADSMRKLSELRQLLTLVPLPDGAKVDPISKQVSADDDMLIDALYRAIVSNMLNHRRWDADAMQAVTVSRVVLQSNNIGRASPNVVRGEPHKEPAGAGSPRRMIEAPKSADSPVSPASSDAEGRREDTTAGGMYLFDVPMKLSNVEAAGQTRGVALCRTALSDRGVHRCSIQVTSLPPLDESLMPACTFGITTHGALDDPEGSPWLGMVWRVGTSLPCALNITATTEHDQPILRGADGHIFVRVGDVLTIETRPREPRARAPTRKYEALYAEQRARLQQTSELVALDAVFLVNGRLVGTVQDVHLMQPFASSSKYRQVDDRGAVAGDDPFKAKRATRGVDASRFGVSLCPGAGVALYDVGCSE